jgi:hypothetical protein
MISYRRIGMKNLASILRVVAFSFVIIIAASSAAMADFYWESVQQTKGMPGRPNETINIKNYLTPYASRSDRAGHITIFNFDTKTMIQIDTATKTYHQMSLDEMGNPPGMNAGGNDQMRQQAMKSMMGSMKVTPTQETRTIDGYHCQKYLVSGMMMNSEYWLSKDVKGYAEMKQIARKVSGVFEQNPMMKQMNIAGMMSQLDGFPVEMTMKIMDGTSTTTLKKIENRTLDKSLFSVPAGYTLVKNPMPMMSK